MANLSAGPPFPHQPNRAACAAQDLASQASNIRGLAGDVSTAHAPAQAAVGGVLSGPMAAAPIPVQDSANQLAVTAIFGAGAIQTFANAIQDYNRTIDRLNERWATESGDNFGVSPPYVPGGATPEQAQEAQAAYAAAVDAARERLRAELRGKQRAAEGELDAAAADSAGMLRRGPNDADAQRMLLGGVFEDLLESFKGQVIPIDWSTVGLTLFGAGRGLQALDVYAKYLTDVTRRGMRYRPGAAPLTLRELRAMRAQVTRLTRLSTRLLGPAGNIVNLVSNIREDGVVEGGAKSAAGITAAAQCAGRTVTALGGRSGPWTTAGATALAGLTCGIFGEEAAERIMEDGGEIAEDVAGAPTMKPSRYGPPAIGWDSPQWMDDATGAVGSAGETAWDNTVGRIPGL
jgi:hypothetical protein